MPRSFLTLALIALSLSIPDVSSAQNQTPQHLEPVQATEKLDHLIELIEGYDEEEGTQAAEQLHSMGEQAVPALMRALDFESNSRKQKAIVKILGSIGPAAKDALPQLMAQLEDDHFTMVNSAAMAIGRIGGADNKSVVRRLLIVRVPKGSDPLIISGYLSTFPKTSLTNLLKLLNDENDAVRKQAAIVIGVMVNRRYPGEPLLSKTDVTRDELGPPLIAKLSDESIVVRIAAAQTLAQLDQKHCRLLIPTAVDAFCQFRMMPRDAVELFRPAANETIPLLIAALDHKRDPAQHYDVVQHNISQTIALMPEEALPHLAKAYDHESSRVRAGVAYALSCYPLPQRSHEAAEALLPFLRDEDAEVRLRGAESIVKLGVLKSDVTVPILIEFLKDKQESRRIRAAKSLNKIGPSAHAAVPALLETLGDDQQDVRTLVAIALVSIDKSQGRATLSTLGAAIQRPEVIADFQRQHLGRQVVVAIGALGPAAEQLADDVAAILTIPTGQTKWGIQILAAETLIKISESKAHLGVSKLTELVADRETTQSAIEALIRQSHQAKPAVAAILAFAKENRRHYYHEPAVVAAIKIDPDNAEAWKLLHQTFEKKSSSGTNRVLSLLLEFDIKSERLLPDLEPILSETRYSSKLVNAITLIGSIGPSAKSAVPSLEKLLSHERETVQQAARTALMKIQK